MLPPIVSFPHKSVNIWRFIPHKNVVFDLGGVVFARDPHKFEPEFIKFFSYILLPEMPRFWEEYDRGMTSYDEVVSQLAEYNSCDRELAQKNLRRSIITQEEIPSTKRLIEQLKEAAAIERAKIDCAEKLFNSISTANVKYHKVATYQDLIDGMNN